MDKICTNCGKHKHFAKGLCKNCYGRQLYQKNKAKHAAQNKKWREDNPEKSYAIRAKSRLKRGHIPMSENKSCASFLGVHIAEGVLSTVFKDVVRQPINNPSFDFICNHGKKIDVKSSCLHVNKKYKSSYWQFHIEKNKIADYFLCLAFDNREKLNPMHIWLVPADKINHLSGATISKGFEDRWNEFELNILKVFIYCDDMWRSR